LINSLEGFDFFLLGAEKDAHVLNEIVSKTGNRANLFIGMPILRAAALIGRSDLFIGSDSGLMHIADSLNVPIVGLFGPSHPDSTGPLNSNVSLIQRDFSCSPCGQKGVCHKTPRCMELISVAEVLETVKKRIKH